MNFCYCQVAFFITGLLKLVQCQVPPCKQFIFGAMGNEVNASCKISSGGPKGFSVVESLLVVSGTHMDFTLSPPSHGRHFSVGAGGKLVLKKLTLAHGSCAHGFLSDVNARGGSVIIALGGIGSFTNVIFSEFVP